MSAALQMMGMMQGVNPMSFSPTPNLFVNPYVDAYLTTVDNNGLRQRGNIIDSAISTTGQALATAGSRPVNNGEGWYFEAGAQMTTGSTSDYNFIHDGSNFDIWVSVFICPTASTTYQRAIICNNGFSTTARGILLRANATAGNNRLECNIGNGTQSFITLAANSALTVNSTNTIRVRRSGSTATMFVNGTQVATQTISLSAGVGNAAGVMTVATALAVSVNYYLKDLVIFNRALTTNEGTSMTSRRFITITPEPTNTYIFIGDSNCTGRGDNSTIAGDLLGDIPGTIVETFNGSPPTDTSSWVGRLLLGTNQTIPSENISTQHGAEMRFGKEMGAIKNTCIIKWGRGSHSAFPRGGGNSPDFHPSSASGAFSQLNTAIGVALADLLHSQRRSPIFRGLIIVLGANDAIFARQGVSWTRSGTSATITWNTHGLITGAVLGIYNSNDLTAIPDGIYTITSHTTNTFTFTVPNAGATSGTVSYSGAYNFKQNIYDLINGILNTITTGRTVDKLRICLIRPTNPIGGLNAEAYTQLMTAITSITTDFLIDNPSRVSNVLEVVAQSTDGFGMLDGLHYNNSGYSQIGINLDDYYDDFINE